MNQGLHLTPELLTRKELARALRNLSGKRIAVDYQRGIDGPQTAARLVTETLEAVGVVIASQKADAAIVIRGGSGNLRFAPSINSADDKKAQQEYESGPRELTTAILGATCRFLGLVDAKPETPFERGVRALVDELDHAKEEVRPQIEQRILREGDVGVEACLLSINQLNRHLNLCALSRNVSGTDDALRALSRRMSLLKKAANPKSIDTLLDVLADSSLSAAGFEKSLAHSMREFPTPGSVGSVIVLPALSEELCALCADALVSIGHPALPILEKCKEDPRRPFRKAVCSVISRIEPRPSLLRTILLGALAGLCPAAGYCILILLYAVSSRVGYIVHAGGSATIINGVPVVELPLFTTLLSIVGTVGWGIIMSRVASSAIRWWQGAALLPASFALAFLLLLPFQMLAPFVSLSYVAPFLTYAISGAALGMLSAGLPSAAMLFVASPLVWFLAMVTDSLLRTETIMRLITGLVPYTVPYLIADNAAHQATMLVLHGIGVAMVLRAIKAPASVRL